MQQSRQKLSTDHEAQTDMVSFDEREIHAPLNPFRKEVTMLSEEHEKLDPSGAPIVCLAD